MKVFVSNEIEQICPEFVGACLEAEVVNSPYHADLWAEIEALGEKFRRELTTESLKELTSISATRRVYKACGKRPLPLPSSLRGVDTSRVARKGTLSARHPR